MNSEKSARRKVYSAVFDEQAVYEHIRYLASEIGPRLIGTDNCKKAGAHITKFFEQLGLDAKEQVFETESVERIDHSLEILEPPLGEIPSLPFLFTPDTPEEGLTGEILFIEEGEEHFLGPEIKGKIVLWSPQARGPSPREIARYDPLAVIIISQIPGIPPRHDIQHENFFYPYSSVTSFRINWEQGHRLIQSEARKARFKLQTRRFPSQGRNIIAELKGSIYPDEIIVVCAHYDSPPDTPSATDNASGTAMMVELARLYAQRGSKRTLRFIAFDGEEAGFLGSAHYLKKLKQEEKTQKGSETYVEGRDQSELEQHLFCLNMDVLGMALGYNTCYIQGPPELTAAIKVMSKELGFAQQVNEGMYGSDNDPFALTGIPGVSFGKMGSDFLFIHTDGDTMNLMNKKQIQKTGGFIDQFLQRYAAGAQVWPFERKVPEEQVKQLTESMKKWMGDYFHVVFSGITDEKG